MNWTGGALERSRKTNASLLAIQRRHFARARNKQKAGNRSSPSIRIFDTIKVQRKVHKQEEPDDLAGSELLEIYHGAIHGTEPRHSYHGKRIPNEISLESSSGRWSGEHRKTPIVISSGSISSTKGHDGTGNVSSQRAASGNLDIKIQRAKLLNTRDWAGVSLTQPAKVKFISSEDRSLIGKRRRLYRSRDIGVDGPYFHSTSRLPTQTNYGRRDHVDHPASAADISVRVGSDVSGSPRKSVAAASGYNPNEISEISDEMLDGPNDHSRHSPSLEKGNCHCCWFYIAI